MLYSFSHPYFALGYLAYKKLVPIVSKQLNKAINRKIKKQKNNIDRFDGKVLKSNSFLNKELIILRRSLDDVLFHSKNDKYVKIWLMLPDKLKFKDWSYIGWDFPKKYPSKHPKFDPKNPDKRKHPETEYFLYYKINIAGKTYYANVKWHKRYNKEVLYTIERNKPATIRKSEPGEE